MEEVQISENIFLQKDEKFGSFNVDVIAQILRDVDIKFALALNIDPFSSCRCNVLHMADHPMICSNPNGGHIIYLSAHDNLWSKWMYQFAHEYCHHLINGPMKSNIEGLMWFEETICELSSMYHLYLASIDWAHYVSPFAIFAVNHAKYLSDLLNQNINLRKTMRLSGYYNMWLPILNHPFYERDYYNAMAAEMFPLFVENHHLWKIILHFGDMRTRSSLEELFEELESDASEDYAVSLGKLKKIFFH